MAYQLIILGGGRMGSALAEGLLAAQYCATNELAIIESSATGREDLKKRFAGVDVHASLELDHVGPHTGVVLCVKPDHAEAAARVCGTVGTMRLLSVVAGLSTARIEAVMPGAVAVIRSMPNTPVLVRKGVTAIAGGVHVTKEDLDWAESVMGAVGSVFRVTEKNLDAVTGHSGPMPAYLFLVIEALIDAGVHQGLSHEMSKQMVIDTFLGSAELLKQSGENPADLRAQVTSPGGTTAAGLRILESRAVRAAFLEAVSAAAERSRQLGR